RRTPAQKSRRIQRRNAERNRAYGSSRGSSSIRSLQYYRRIDAAKAERIAQRELYLLFAADVRDVVQVAALAGLVEIERRRQPIALQRERRDRELERAGRAQRMTIV